MATRAATPGGALLRASRLFSLPSKLPRPPGEITIVASRVSTTSTAVFPTLQSVTTTQSSRNRGDWGFKRPLPRHTTASTSTPLVRVKHVDSIEAVTDFASAADHTLSLQKWHEMNLPVVSQSFTERNNNILGKSVFEDSVDFTAFDPSQRDQVQDRRWKFDGPWLPGINEAAFRRYMATHVRPKRAEFRQFLRQQLVRDLNSEAAEKAFDGGKTAVVLGEDDITDEQLDEYMRALRNGPSRATLYGLISKFLDLAPVQPPSDHFAQLGSLAPPVAGRATSPYAKSGPLVTHSILGHVLPADKRVHLQPPRIWAAEVARPGGGQGSDAQERRFCRAGEDWRWRLRHRQPRVRGVWLAARPRPAKVPLVRSSRRWGVQGDGHGVFSTSECQGKNQPLCQECGCRGCSSAGRTGGPGGCLWPLGTPPGGEETRQHRFGPAKNAPLFNQGVQGRHGQRTELRAGLQVERPIACGGLAKGISVRCIYTWVG